MASENDLLARSVIRLHMSRAARDRYGIAPEWFAADGHVLFPTVQSVRLFAQRINDVRAADAGAVGLPEAPEATEWPPIKAGQLNALALISTILHYVAHQYLEQTGPAALTRAQGWLGERLGADTLEAALYTGVEQFPPQVVYAQELAPTEYLDAADKRAPVLEDLLMVWLDNVNPAAAPFTELFDDRALELETSYLRIMHLLREYFATLPAAGPGGQNLVDLLRAPAIASPLSLEGQLRYIRDNWGALLGDFLARVLGSIDLSIDLIKEEDKPSFQGPGPAEVLEFAGPDAEYERFSADQEWMPRLVLLAKSTYVWLDQLSKKYGRAITWLDQIPDEELDILARWGFSGLWLIGLWERSVASQRIKQRMGNPEAVASAYSLYDYTIAADLGGEEAYRNLAGRTWQRGIRLASDMVPNHMGIDAKWVIEHPDWFLSLDYSPYPAYSFNGPDLSSDDRVGIFLEDHYYDKTDAAVVFKRVDHWSGSTRYIYHGNDGTSMPWNDTAQLDYLNPTVREAVIQTILEVARRFPVIRFDAAMVLAKRHIQRLWHPEPGAGGAIASRAEHALSKGDFDAAIPEEFWREVVERVKQEVPDTLLLAEAFWMLEGYFVRTLGMHRVYNSAFMHMLKMEDNAKYRQSIKNVLEFDPEILKRYVNFMNNPDEETAEAQFGRDDRYFGVCMLMVTMPGLPMIGHGQIEGYTEKYGMEYRRAYKDEQPDEWLVGRHEREIFPLMRRRHIFSGVRNFLLYDFYSATGGVNEDVFAYSNSSGDWLGSGERALVLYNNKFANAAGWIRTSAAFSVKTGIGDNRTLVQKTLGEGLGLHRDAGPAGQPYFTLFREQVTQLEFIRSSQKLCDEGLYAELGAFKYQVFMDFREVEDGDGHYARLAALLNGRGVPSIDDALAEMLKPPEPEPVVPFPRASGILLHVTSLPGGAGIGDLGPAAYRFVDFLAAGGQQYWQIMPLGPTSYGDSPYQALSAFAGNPLLISLDALVEQRYLAAWDLDPAAAFPADRVDFGSVINFKLGLLRIAYENFRANPNPELEAELAAFVAAHRAWLDDFTLFAALKQQHGGASWSTWERDIATRDPEALARWRAELQDELRFQEFMQFLFDRQWAALKAYTNERGVSIIGDAPIFVAYDSADAWANPELFHFDADGKPTLVAGVPPDYFSPTGQLWGNPLYNWEALAATGYAWWIARSRRAFQQVDVVRLDHFRGFAAGWAIAADEETAENGAWQAGPGRELFEAVAAGLEATPAAPIRFIAEDLGLITPEVEALRAACGFPGMRVLQFAFDGDPDNLYLPYNYDQNTVVYTGTHDNDTTLGWFSTAGEDEQATVRRYLAGSVEDLNWAMIRLALASVAHTAIVPLQDVLGLGGAGVPGAGRGRMNTPGLASGNWTWRYTEGLLTEELSARLAELVEIYGRGRREPDAEPVDPAPTD